MVHNLNTAVAAPKTEGGGNALLWILGIGAAIYLGYKVYQHFEAEKKAKKDDQ